jgi:RNA polymerase sigma-70 factor (ECF subfamily)
MKEIFLAKNVCQQQSETFIQLLRSGDERAFAKLIDKYKETVFLCCRGLGLRDDEAEDVTSETFLAAYKGMRHYSGQAELSTWLWSIAYRQAVNYLRKNRRKCTIYSEQRTANNELQTPNSSAENSEKAEIV